MVLLHDRLIRETGGAGGLRDAGLLASALHRALGAYGGVELYPDIVAQVAALMDGLIRDHPFVDGNKRTAMAAGISVLRVNGFDFVAAADEVERLAVALAERRLSLAQLAEWIRGQVRKSP